MVEERHPRCTSEQCQAYGGWGELALEKWSLQLSLAFELLSGLPTMTLSVGVTGRYGRIKVTKGPSMAATPTLDRNRLFSLIDLEGSV